MVRIIYSSPAPSTDSEVRDEWKQYIEANGLSTDTKPDYCATGSIFVEVDTGKVFFFDEDSDWVEQFSFQG